MESKRDMDFIPSSSYWDNLGQGRRLSQVSVSPPHSTTTNTTIQAHQENPRHGDDDLHEENLGQLPKQDVYASSDDDVTRDPLQFKSYDLEEEDDVEQEDVMVDEAREA